MKKLSFGFVLCVMLLVLAACSVQEKRNDVTQAGAQEADNHQTIGLANPWVYSDRAGVLDAAGFDLVAPAGASDVAYSYMPSTGMAQMVYTLENAEWVYRIQPTDALTDISGIYCAWNYIEEAKVAGMDAMEYSYASKPEGDFVDNMECTRVINWFDAQNKVSCSLSVVGSDLNGMDTSVYAQELFTSSGIYVPKSDGIAPVSEEVSKGFRETDPYKSYLGRHVNVYDGSEIVVEEGGENDKLKVSVSIFRLCTLDDGVGSYENGLVSFHATDPNGNPIRCSLYRNLDNSLCLEIEESTWEYLPAGTVIDGFDN